jgi:hypothetical protein
LRETLARVAAFDAAPPDDAATPGVVAIKGGVTEVPDRM